MAEQTFRSPGFFEQEIELIAGENQPAGTPVGVVGTARLGPAFVPVTVGNFEDFVSKFGTLDDDMPGTHAVYRWLEHKTALTYIKVLGAGANKTAEDISDTIQNGTVKNAGFKLAGNGIVSSPDRKGYVTFIAATHQLSAEADWSAPMFVDNPSFDVTSNKVNLIRAMVFLAPNTRMSVHAASATVNGSTPAAVSAQTSNEGKFKLAFKDGSNFIGSYTISLNPKDPDYIANVLNTDPSLFDNKFHLLYAEFPVDSEVASVKTNESNGVAALVGKTTGLANGYGRFDTRYQAARTTSFISQPYGKMEYDLFHFECISDGSVANNLFKISIQNLLASTDKSNPYGTFDVVLRKFDDDDLDPQIIEYFPKLTLDPNSESYIGKKIGDKKISYFFDADVRSERRLVVSGKFANKSKYIRVVMSDILQTGNVPPDALPFGFRGLPVLKTTPSLKDGAVSLTFDGETFTGISNLTGSTSDLILSGAVLPPVPYRFKVTRGNMIGSDDVENIGAPGMYERVDGRLYWGAVVQSVPTDNVRDPNSGASENKLLRNYSKFLGISKLDNLLTGSAADVYNANKFTLSRVVLAKTSEADVAGSADVLMKGASYVRDGTPSAQDYKIQYNVSSRVSMATIIHSSSVVFNRFSTYNKFTNIFYGGFDGLDILDKDAYAMNDRASSVDAGGKANDVLSGNGVGVDNNIINSYRVASDIITDEMSSRVNMVVIPGIKEPLVQNYLGERARNNSMVVHIRDIPAYDDDLNRIFVDSTAKPNIRNTTEQFASLGLDNNYSAAYYPDVSIQMEGSPKRIKMPATVAALGAIAYNDKISYPWFAPAGFNRGALDFVSNVDVRLNAGDRDMLYDARINPIATFPSGGFVIFGQKTLQLSKSSLDRLNVRRLIVEVKRVVGGSANRLLFEPNNESTRQRFITAVTPKLAEIRSQAGIESFKVIMDGTNNSQVDVDSNRINGTIIIVPTRTIEYIAVDFVISNSGVMFQ